MPEKKREEFVVTDRRKFTFEGDARPDVAPEPEGPSEPAAQAPETAPPPAAQKPASPEQQTPAQVPEPPSAAERSEQQAAYSASGKQFNDMAATATGRTAKDFEMNFEKVVVSLYMTALMQLGLMQQEGAPARADLVGAKQTIDTLGVLAEKTKGNLTMQEDNLLQNCLYELRMAFIEITNAIARGPAPGAPGVPRGGKK